MAHTDPDVAFEVLHASRLCLSYHITTNSRSKPLIQWTRRFHKLRSAFRRLARRGYNSIYQFMKTLLFSLVRWALERERERERENHKKFRSEIDIRKIEKHREPYLFCLPTNTASPPFLVQVFFAQASATMASSTSLLRSVVLSDLSSDRFKVFTFLSRLSIHVHN